MNTKIIFLPKILIFIYQVLRNLKIRLTFHSVWIMKEYIVKKPSVLSTLEVNSILPFANGFGHSAFILLPPDCITTAFYNANMKINTKSILWLNLFLQRLQNSMQSQQVVRTMWVLDWVPWNRIPRPLWWRAFNQDKLLWSIFAWIFLFLYGPLPQPTEIWSLYTFPSALHCLKEFCLFNWYYSCGCLSLQIDIVHRGSTQFLSFLGICLFYWTLPVSLFFTLSSHPRSSSLLISPSPCDVNIAVFNFILVSLFFPSTAPSVPTCPMVIIHTAPLLYISPHGSAALVSCLGLLSQKNDPPLLSHHLCFSNPVFPWVCFSLCPGQQHHSLFYSQLVLPVQWHFFIVSISSPASLSFLLWL